MLSYLGMLDAATRDRLSHMGRGTALKMWDALSTTAD